MLFEHDRREERRLEAVGAAVADDAAEAAQRRASARLVVVRELVEVPLDRSGVRSRAMQPPLARRKQGYGLATCRRNGLQIGDQLCRASTRCPV